MFSQFKYFLLCGAIAPIMVLAAANAMAASKTVDCTGGGDLQKEIDKAKDGDIITIKGICMTNIVIRDKALTLVGDSSAGPHGITGAAADTDAVGIENSRGTHLEGLVIGNPHFAGVRIRFNSDVTMTDVEVSDCGAGGATGIWVQRGSALNGTRLRLDDNLRGLGASDNSTAFCYECDLNDNATFAAFSNGASTISLLDSEVNGQVGIGANQQSYVDIDCATYSSAHNCSLNATHTAGLAYFGSTVSFYGAGDFTGSFFAVDRSKVEVLGARQQSLPGANSIEDNSSMEVRELGGNSRVMGHTDILGFSNAIFYGGSTDLDGTLDCSAGGDAWADGAVDLTSYTITGCTHAP